MDFLPNPSFSMVSVPHPRSKLAMAKRILPALQAFMKILVDRPITPAVHEEDGTRCLRFNGGVVQSTMRVEAPYELDLSYTRAMMGFMLFNLDPRQILIIGLGGGSLSKYCYRRFPQAKITSVEINPEVIALRNEFRIPADDERFEIVEADGCEYMTRPDVHADVILLDGYDAEGLPNCLSSESFYATCWRVLNENGVLSANLWGGEPNRTLFINRLNSIFDGRVWWSKPSESQSVIAYAVKNKNFYPHWSRLMSTAHTLAARYRLDFPRIVEHMRARPDPDG